MSDFNVMTIGEIEALSAKNGCDVVVAADNELQFDLDNIASLAQFEEFYAGKLCSLFSVLLPRKEWKSKSGNRHIVLTLPNPLSIVERIALQSMGGSDVGREIAALNCYWNNSLHPLLLFKPKATR